MPLLGLLGKSLKHSFSKDYFNNKFSALKMTDWKYINLEIQDIKDLPFMLAKYPELIGFNVTIPYKTLIFKYLSEIDPTAKKIGAVNTVKIIRKNNKTILKGFNTDIFGFEKSLNGFIKDLKPDALILGTGGAAKAVAFVLEKKGIRFQFVSHSKKQYLNYTDLNRQIIDNHRLIINTTPLGMFPAIDTYPQIPYEFLTPNHYLYDLVYNPVKTKFLQLGEKKGAKIKNGFQMLIEQAEASFRIWMS